MTTVMTTVRNTSATWEPVSLETAKNQLRLEIGYTDDDDLIQSCIATARLRIEEITNRKLSQEVWTLYRDEWPGEDSLEIPYPPLQSVASTGITYKNSTGVTAALSSTAWESDTAGEPGRVVLKYNNDWPINTLWPTNPIAIRFTCGYTTQSKVPPTIKSAMLLLIDDLYHYRTVNSDTMDAVKSLIGSQRFKMF